MAGVTESQARGQASLGMSAQAGKHAAWRNPHAHLLCHRNLLHCLKTKASDPKPAGQQMGTSCYRPLGIEPPWSTRVQYAPSSFHPDQTKRGSTHVNVGAAGKRKQEPSDQRTYVRRVAPLAASRQLISVYAVDAVDAVSRLDVSCLAVSRLAAGQEVHNPIQSGDKPKQYLTPIDPPDSASPQKDQPSRSSERKEWSDRDRGSHEVSDRTIPHFRTASTIV
jgi:hypothetical protein